MVSILGLVMVVELKLILFVLVSSRFCIFLDVCILLLMVSGIKYFLVVWFIRLNMVLWFLCVV